MGIRGDLLAVPLSFIAQLAAIGAKPDGITRRAPGCTSRLPPQAPFQPVEGPLCPLVWTLLFPFLALIVQYISILRGWCQALKP